MTLEEESQRATAMLLGKKIRRVMRFRDRKVMIEFEDGSKFYADSAAPVEISITMGD